MQDNPRPEYPRPQFKRDAWLNLNGEWFFADDPGDSGESRDLHLADALPDKIRVPFCREAALSGLGWTDRVLAVWYTRTVEIPQDWAGKTLLLHFGAADYDTTVWANGTLLGHHEGGHCGFTFTIEPALITSGQLRLNVRCRDDWRKPRPAGKQSPKPENFGIHYTRTTGIWQTVWLEPVPETRLERPRITPELATWTFQIEQPLTGLRAGCKVQASLLAEGKAIATDEAPADVDFTPTLRLSVPEDCRHLWQPGAPFLYDVELQLVDASGMVIDHAISYAGMRSVRIEGDRFLLNGKPIFQRLVLDQGYYPDGILTAPTDAALRADIELAMQAGFNGARLHQKIFEERFLYHADTLGYLVWGELPDWGPAFCTDHRKVINTRWVTEWQEALARDYNHPALVAWGCLNEQEFQSLEHLGEIDSVMRALFQAAKLADRTRPVLDASGWIHRIPESDLYDVHDYEKDPALLRKTYAEIEPGKAWCADRKGNLPHRGQPFFVSEFGGIRIPKPGDDAQSWGYGTTPENIEAFYERFSGLCQALLENPKIAGYCYTQLTDVYQEANGVYDFARQPKSDIARLREAQSIRAACEAEN